jgi:hypothetical protein
VDGDGRAEACAYADGLFRCDTRHDGGGAEWTLRFGQRGDQPLLGDFDGDGQDDPCVYRGASSSATRHTTEVRRKGHSPRRTRRPAGPRQPRRTGRKA